MYFLTVIGLIATGLTTVQNFPQARKTLLTRKADDFSYVALVVNSTACTLWTFYGVMIRDVFLTVASASVASTQLMILVVKLFQKPALENMTDEL